MNSILGSDSNRCMKWQCQCNREANARRLLLHRFVSDEDWKEAMALWNAMVYDVEHPSMKCTDDDRTALLAMKAELTVVDVVGGEWQELFEGASEEIENALDEGLQMLEELFRE